LHNNTRGKITVSLSCAHAQSEIDVPAPTVVCARIAPRRCFPRFVAEEKVQLSADNHHFIRQKAEPPTMAYQMAK